MTSTARAPVGIGSEAERDGELSTFESGGDPASVATFVLSPEWDASEREYAAHARDLFGLGVPVTCPLPQTCRIGFGTVGFAMKVMLNALSASAALVLLSGVGTWVSSCAPAEESFVLSDEPAAPQAKDRFAPGGAVSDADLARYHVALDCAIDGEAVGTMTFELWTEAAPITTRNFLRLCETGFYDGLSFHRIMRSFMVQGGDARGDGSGTSPFGSIEGEFSTEPERQHGYGVLSMARFGRDENSASSQFFLCCDETEPVWNLDGQYASFGRMTSGVKTLEAIANVEVGPSQRGEMSRPKVTAKITKARVLEGVAPTGEVIERPEVEVDLKGEPARVKVEIVSIPFQGLPGVDASLKRTSDEARALAEAWVAHFADPEEAPRPEDGDLGTPLLLLNHGLRDGVAERKRFDLFKEFQIRSQQLTAELRERRVKGELTPDEEREAGAALEEEFRGRIEAMQ
ncbi:MAG: peptidylprolyl isomerase, partial [Planctomycetota bacterium]